MGAEIKGTGESGMGYTLKQAADKLGLTKPGLRYRLKAMNLPTEKDDSGRIVISSEVLQRIITGEEPERTPESEEELSGNKAESEGDLSGKSERKPEIMAESGKNSESNDSALDFALNELRHQLEVKDQQIADLTAQLANVTEALRAAQRTAEGSQALQAASVKMLQEAIRPGEDQPEDGKAGDETTEKKHRLFGWLLRK